MAIKRGKLAMLVGPGLAHIYFNRLKQAGKEYDQWINVRTSKRAYEEDFNFAGFGGFTRKAEGGVYTFDEPLEGDVRRYTHVTYGLGFRVTEEMYEDDQYGVMNRLTKELAKSAAHNKEVRAASVLNNGWNPAQRGFDGLPLFHTVHPRLDNAGTQANTPVVQADITKTSLQAAIESFLTMVDDRGLPLQMMPKTLRIGPANIWAANEVLGSEKDPSNNNNTINVLNTKFNITIQLTRYFTDPDMWVLLGGKDEHDLNMYIRVNDEFNSDNDPLTGDAIETGRHRLSSGFGAWQGAYGSQGA